MLRRRAIVAAHLLSESMWIYALGAVIGAVTGNGRAPLAWWTVAALLAASYLAMRFLQLVRMTETAAMYLNALMAALAVYLAIGSELSPGPIGLNPTWPLRLGAAEESLPLGFIAIIGGLLGAGLWWRGGRLATNSQPVESLEFSFRIGLLTMALAVIVDVAASDDLNILPLMFAFFAASLMGLGIGNLRPAAAEASSQRPWLRAIGAVVGGILGAGLLFALAARLILPWLAGPASRLFDLLAAAVFYAVILPLGYLLGFLVQIAVTLLSWLGPDEFQAERGLQMGERLQAQRELEAAEAPGYLAYAEWTLLALIALAALFFIGRAFRRRMIRVEEEQEAVRESVAGGANPLSDAARLLHSLLPDRFKRTTPDAALRIPEGDPDVAEMFRVYFGMLSLARKSGLARQPSETPREYMSTLETIFPSGLVRSVTDAFDMACYGNRAPARPQIDDMRLSLERLAAGNGS